MTFRTFSVAAISVSLYAGAALAQSAPLDFGKGPAQYVMTAQEAAQWRTIRTAEEAQAFIDLFWARRDPTPATPQNEFREEFEARAEYADKKWSEGRTRGSMTHRGKLVILLGTDVKVSRSANTATPSGALGGDPAKRSIDNNLVQERWLFNRSSLPKFAAGGQAEFLLINRTGGSTMTLDAASQRFLNELATKAAVASIVRPELTAADLTASAAPKKIVEVGIPGPVITTPSVATAFKNAALAQVVTSFKAATTTPYKNVHATFMEGVTAEGEYFVPVQVFVSKAAGATADAEYTFIGQVEDESGKVVAVYEEPAKLVASKNDFYFDRTLVLPSGKYTGYFGLVSADGKPLGVVKLPMTLQSIDKSATGTSPLILSNNIYALPQAQRPTDPFAFGGLKVVPKADRTFLTSDELGYFVELRNPTLGENGQPRFQIGVDIVDAKGNRKTSPPSEVEVLALKGVPGRYFIGSGYPLTSFAPGKYTMKVKLYDMVNKKNTYSFEEKFTVVGAN